MHVIKSIFLPLIAASCAMLLLAQEPGSGITQDCKTVERALETYYSLKPGMTRGEVEKAFMLEGGIQFASPSRYTYKGCRYIKLVVEYELSRRNGLDGPFLSSGDDKIKELSKLLVDYPTMD